MSPFPSSCAPEVMLEHIARALVDHPESVRVEVSGSPQTAVYVLHVHQSDIGKVIGRGGRTINIIRDLLVPVAARIQKRIIFDVFDGQPGAGRNGARGSKSIIAGTPGSLHGPL
jgi:hypothetical protein